MPNWLASELCMVASFSLGAWKTFKVLKHGGTDYNLLKTWCLLGLLRAFEEYFEFLVSWIPFYWLGKCLGLGLLYLPGGNIPTVVFERFVVWGMDNAHHVLNNLVVPNVVQFAVSLPWRVLLVLFPTLPSSGGGGGGGGDSARRAAMSNGGQGRAPKKRGKKGGELSYRLQHLNTPTKRHPATTMSGAASRSGVAAEGSGGNPSVTPGGEGGSRQPPPLPPRSPPTSPSASTAAVGRVGGGGAEASRKSNASALVDQLLRADNDGGRGDAATEGGAGAVSTPVRGGDGAGANGESTSPESGPGLSGGSGRSRPRRRRSFGEILRSAVTGSSKVRLRDHLFDLNTASPAPPLPDGDRNHRYHGAAPDQPSHRSRSPSSSARAEPAIGGGSGSDGTRSSKRRHATAAPRKASASTLPAVSGSYGNRDRRRGNKIEMDEEEEDEEEDDMAVFSPSSSPPPRPNGLIHRRPSEFDGGGGGGGDEAGGGGSSDALSRIGRGRRERDAGVGVGGAGRRSMQETTGSPSSFSSNGGSSTGRSTASRASAAARGGPITSTRTTVSRSAAAAAAAAPAAGDISAAAAIADSRAKRLADWRKKRADKSRNEQAGRLRRTSGGGGGDEEGSIRGGVVTRASASARADAAAPPPAKSRRFRHVERLRSEMARNAPGAAPRGPQEEVAGGAVSPPTQTAGSLRQKRGLMPAMSSSSRS